jgi:TPR repeat protein
LTKNKRIAALTILLVIAVGVLLSVGEPTLKEQEANVAIDNAYKARDFKTTTELATKYANLGNIHAQVILATLYRKGEGVEADPMKAAGWYKMAAAQGDPYAQNMLGEMLLRDGPLRRDYGQALIAFHKAARQGLKEAKLNLCRMYYLDQDLGNDYARSVEKLHVQAHIANPLAPYEMGQMYLAGSAPKSKVQDYGEAARWFRMAALQGMPDAQIELGQLYERGLGVPQDYVMAHMWFNVAASLLSNTYVEGERANAAGLRDSVGARMTPQQIADAQALARDWKPTPWDLLMGRQITPASGTPLAGAK